MTKKITLDFDAMTEPQRKDAVAVLARVLFPEKGLHQPTLIALTREGFEPKVEAKKDDRTS